MPGILTALEELLAHATAGDPVSGMKWTHRSLCTLQRALQRRGFKVSPPTIARLLRDRDFSLRTCRKNKAGTRHQDRDRQFRYLVRLRSLYRTLGWPVISVDTKKKELVGDFKNPGRRGRLTMNGIQGARLRGSPRRLGLLDRPSARLVRPWSRSC